MNPPMDVTDASWVYHTRLTDETVNVGKWMLFWPNTLLNAKWQAICRAWDEGQLLGVFGMKCSTARPNPRSSNPHEGVIIMYCNNSEDEEHIMDIGKRISLHLHDYPREYIYYKTDEQTHVGTAATGAINNSTYRLDLERSSGPLFRK
jgi:hypothetical protein